VDALTELLFSARLEAARLRECLDLFDVGICVVDRTHTSLDLALTNSAMEALDGQRVASVDDVLSLFPADDARTIRDALHADESIDLGLRLLQSSGRHVGVATYVLEADLHDSVVLVVTAS
jgi:hypothetical protein